MISKSKELIQNLNLLKSYKIVSRNISPKFFFLLVTVGPNYFFDMKNIRLLALHEVGAVVLSLSCILYIVRSAMFNAK